MTIRKGAQWGSFGPLGKDGVIVATDAEARAVVEEAKRAGRPVPPLGLSGGDLCKTLGGTGNIERLHTSEATTCSVDLGSVLIDGRIHWFVAHLIARRSWWKGRVVAIMNAQWLGDLDLGPRAHPGDGLLDVSDGNMPISDRFEARRRARTGSHLPHPQIRTTRTPAIQLEFDPPLTIRLDNVPLGRAKTISVRVEPDALTVVI